jgi:hypothetical protein
MDLFEYTTLPVADTPFPHVLVDSFLEPDAYRDLEASFPACPPNSGPTGYSHFWGDPAFDDLLREHAVWRRLFEQTQSQAFVDFVLRQFAPVFAEQAIVDLSAARYVPYVESRADKEARHLPATGRRPADLFVRTDILQGNLGYSRKPHLDHCRRAAAMLIYFGDGGESGGDLVLHGPSGARKTIVPRRNRMVMFPCFNGSLHSVSKITAQRGPRNFVQVSVSSTVDLWARVPEDGCRIRNVLKQTFGRFLPAS